MIRLYLTQDDFEDILESLTTSFTFSPSQRNDSRQQKVDEKIERIKRDYAEHEAFISLLRNLRDEDFKDSATLWLDAITWLHYNQEIKFLSTSSLDEEAIRTAIQEALRPFNRLIPYYRKGLLWGQGFLFIIMMTCCHLTR